MTHVMLAGINSTNTLHCLYGSVSKSGRSLDGVAVVSDIVASTDPRMASQKIATIVKAFKVHQQPVVHRFSMTNPTSDEAYTAETLRELASTHLLSIRKFSPLVHQVRLTSLFPVPCCATLYCGQCEKITNNVVTNQSANATLALGASPIMATSPEEMEDLSRAIGALLVNFGTIKDLDGMLAAGKVSC